MALTDNLESYWKLDEAANADAVDAHGSNTLTDENGVGSSGSGAREFVSTNDESLYRSSNSILQVGNIDFTLFAKVRLADVSFTQVIISKYDDATTETEYALLYEIGETAGRFGFAVTGAIAGYTTLYANTFGDVDVNTDYCLHGWHNAADNTINISVDGISDSVSYSDGVIVGDGKFRLSGVGEPIGLGLDGLMYNAGLWKRVLTSEEQATVCSLEYPFMATAESFKGVIPVGFYALMRAWNNVSMSADGFKGYTSIGMLAFMRGFNSGGTPIPPIDDQSSMKPMYYRRRHR